MTELRIVLAATFWMLILGMITFWPPDPPPAPPPVEDSDLQVLYEPATTTALRTLHTDGHHAREPLRNPGTAMMYFANPTAGTADLMSAGVIGYIDTPSQGNKRPAGVTWCADNGCWGKGFDTNRWWRWLQSNAAAASTCVFATAPDVVGSAAETLERARPWLPKIRDLGYPAAYVAQDGIGRYSPPWDEFDVLFIGGTTEFKLSTTARRLVYKAKDLGKHVHAGRVNSLRRYRWAEAIGCDSVDGTYLVFGPDTNLPKLLRWIDDIDQRPALFRVES